MSAQTQGQRRVAPAILPPCRMWQASILPRRLPTMSADLQDLRAQMVEAANAVVRSGAISLSGHGNLSIRVPGRDEMLYTAGATMSEVRAGNIVRIALDGSVLEGEVPPMAAAVIAMH